MIDLKARCGALPEMPNPEDFCCPSVDKLGEVLRYHQLAFAAEVCRLALQCDLIRERLVDGCKTCGGTNVWHVLNTGADLRPVGDWYDAPCPTCADWRALLEATKP